MCYIITRSLVPLIDVTSSGGGGIGTTLANPGTLIPNSGEVLAGNSFNLPAGAYKATVWNTGLEDITVGGVTVPPGKKEEQEHAYNKTTNRQDFTTSLLIVVPAGGHATYLAQYPST